MLFDNLSRVCRRDTAVPHCLWIHHDRWPMLALIQASSFVDAHGSLEQPGHACGPGTLLQFREQFAFSIYSA
jgi:hypothetical protein